MPSCWLTPSRSPRPANRRARGISGSNTTSPTATSRTTTPWARSRPAAIRPGSCFGLLTLRRGRWRDKQIIPEAWVKLALTPTPVQPTYGFMNWFLNTDLKGWPDAPSSTFCHVGAGNNVACQIPEYDVVVVARWITGAGINGLLKRVVASVTDVTAMGKASAP